jgi:hypothetical protein
LRPSPDGHDSLYQRDIRLLRHVMTLYLYSGVVDEPCFVRLAVRQGITILEFVAYNVRGLLRNLFTGRCLREMTLMPFEFRDLSCYTPCNRTSNARGIIFRRKERKNTQQMQHQHASHKKEKKEKNAVMLTMHEKKRVPKTSTRSKNSVAHPALESPQWLKILCRVVVST